MEEIRDVKIARYCEILDEVAKFVSKNTSWYPIQKDFELNSQKLKLFMDPPYNYKYMGKGFCEDAKNADFFQNNDGFAMAAVWSLRGLRFIKLMIEELRGKEEQSMGSIPEKCYDRTLKNHHGFMTRTVSSGILKLVSLSDLPAWKTFGFHDAYSSKVYIQSLYEKITVAEFNVTMFLKVHKIDEVLFK